MADLPHPAPTLLDQRAVAPAWSGRVLALLLAGMIVALSASSARAQSEVEFAD
jgi:hypothetical protein